MVAAFATLKPTGRRMSATNRGKEHTDHSLKKKNEKKRAKIVSERGPLIKQSNRVRLCLTCSFATLVRRLYGCRGKLTAQSPCQALKGFLDRCPPQPDLTSFKRASVSRYRLSLYTYLHHASQAAYCSFQLRSPPEGLPRHRIRRGHFAGERHHCPKHPGLWCKCLI